MTEQEHYNEALKDRELASKELVKMATHLRRCDDVLADARARLEKQKFRVTMSMDEMHETLVGTV